MLKVCLSEDLLKSHWRRKWSMFQCMSWVSHLHELLLQDWSVFTCYPFTLWVLINTYWEKKGYVETLLYPFLQSYRGYERFSVFIPIITNSTPTLRIQFFQEECLLHTQHWTTEWKMLNPGNPSLLYIKHLVQYVLVY